VYEIDRAGVEPLQILKDKNERLHARAGERPTKHRSELPAMNLVGRKVRRPIGWNRNVDQRRHQRSMLRGVQLDLRENRLELSEPSFR
jgi:hypothetical protein